MNAKDRLIVALDVDTKEKALHLAALLKNDVGFFKIGLELFSACGPSIVEEIDSLGCKVFLDLKYHDIPNTVAKASSVLTGLGIFMFNVHALGGYEMMNKAALAVKEEAAKIGAVAPKVIAVTILTSMDEIALKKVGINDNMKSEVIRLARLAKDAGLDGVVASPQEASLIREETGEDFLIVTPGVRPLWSASGDQKRFTTPSEAVRAGASYIVVGRPITGDKDIVGAAKKIIEEISI